MPDQNLTGAAHALTPGRQGVYLFNAPSHQTHGVGIPRTSRRNRCNADRSALGCKKTPRRAGRTKMIRTRTALRLTGAGLALALLANCGRHSELDCMQRAMYFESNRSSRDGMVAVGTVVMNRVRVGRVPDQRLWGGQPTQSVRATDHVAQDEYQNGPATARGGRVCAAGRASSIGR